MKIKNNNGVQTDTNPIPDSGAPWPCPPPAPTPLAWPETRPSVPPGAAAAPPLKYVLKLQQKATNAFRESFVESGSDDNEPNDDSDEEEEDCCSDLGEEKLQFFLSVFVEDDELRRYYEDNFEGGEFFCLVCGGVGGKGSGKRFKSCHGLVQHASTVSNIETNRSHQAFGLVVCKVLGWDFDKIPNLVSKGEPLGRTLGNGSGKKKPEEAFHGVVKEDSDDEKFLEEKNENTIRDEEKPYEDANEKDRKDEKEGSFENSAVSKIGSLDQPLAQLGVSEVFEQPPVPSSSDTEGWPILTRPNLAPTLSAEEEALFAADQLQYKAVRLCKAFLMANSNSCSSDLDDSDNEEEAEDEEDSETENDDLGDSSKELDFFLKLFSDDAKLRDFYCGNSEKGDFCCLVCGGIDKKVWKRFKGCVALVQHSAAISKTRRKRAHRAYGRAVCQILGWDANRFLSIHGVELND